MPKQGLWLRSKSSSSTSYITSVQTNVKHSSLFRIAMNSVHFSSFFFLVACLYHVELYGPFGSCCSFHCGDQRTKNNIVIYYLMLVGHKKQKKRSLTAAGQYNPWRRPQLVSLWWLDDWEPRFSQCLHPNAMETFAQWNDMRTNNKPRQYVATSEAFAEMICMQARVQRACEMQNTISQVGARACTILTPSISVRVRVRLLARRLLMLVFFILFSFFLYYSLLHEVIKIYLCQMRSLALFSCRTDTIVHTWFIYINI